MTEDQTDESYIGPLFDTNAAKQIDLEDIIKAAPPKPKRKEKITRTVVSDHLIIIGVS